MIIDKEDHRTILLQLIDKTNFPGEMMDVMWELRDTIRNATIKHDSGEIITKFATPDRKS